MWGNSLLSRTPQTHTLQKILAPHSFFFIDEVILIKFINNHSINIIMSFLNSKNNNEQEFQNIPLICPRCKIYMKKIHKNGVTIDYCTQCQGMWLDKSEFDKLLET